MTNNLWSVAHGGIPTAQWVAVGEQGTILTSPDGISWTKRPSGFPTRWLVSVGYGAGVWIAVGEGGLVLTSPDALVWTPRASGTTARLNGIAYGGGRWIAVAESGELITSTDSVTWTKLSPSTDRLRGLLYAYGQFVITGDNGLMRTTIDTTDYAANVLPGGFFVESVAYGRRAFVAVGEDGYAITSTDAVTWSSLASGTAAYLRGITFFNGQFIAVGTGGAATKTVLVRGIGPGLAAFGLTGLLPNPKLTLFDAAGKTIATNDDFVSSATPNGLVAAVSAFPLSNSRDAALVSPLPSGSYTVQLTDSGAGSGVALVEVYEADDNANRIVNLSSRAFVGIGASIAIGGISVQGEKPRQFLIRGIGPALRAFGVNSALGDPVLTLTTALGATVATNDDWGSATNAFEIIATSAKVGAFALPSGSTDAVILISLAPGNYTALISGANDTTGIALVEVYEVP